MKTAHRILFLPLIALMFSAPMHAQDCTLEAVATLTTQMWGGEISFSISDDNGVLVEASNFEDNSVFTTTFCLDNATDCVVLEMVDSFGDGWNGAVLDISIPVLGLDLGSFTLETGSAQAITFGVGCDTEEVEIEGCTDSFAFNYNPAATADDGSCSYDCECEDVDDPVCALDPVTGVLLTYANLCEALCAQAIFVGEGDCNDLPVYGCTDPEALNFDPEATEDDGSCVADLDCGSDQILVQAQLTTALWGGEVSFTISDENGPLVEGQGIEDYATTALYFCLDASAGCLTLEMIDSFGDGWNGAVLDISIPALGLDLGSFTLETGSAQAFTFGAECETEEVEIEGCTDPFAFNYNPAATVDDGSCSYDCECEDVYDPVCGYDFFTDEYVTYNNACEAQCAQAYILWDSDCADVPVYGCMDEEAINYNPDATQDDGSCVVIPTCGEDETAVAIEVVPTDSTSEWGYSVYWNLTDETGWHVDLVYDYSQWEATNAYGCLEDGCYNFFLYNYGWSDGAANVEVNLGGETTAYSLAPGEFDAAYAIGVNTNGCEVFIPIHGCTDAEAMNYNPEANLDDGSCLYPCECDDVYDPVCAYDYFTGDYVTFNNACEAECWNAWVVWEGDCADQHIYGCMDAEALNYNPEATNDDGSCAVIPVCDASETQIIIQTTASDSLNEFGVSLHWSLSTDLGQYINLVYDYDGFQTTSYGCVADGCYNFYLSDFSWVPGVSSAEVILDDEVSSYVVPANVFSETFALGVNTEGCVVTIPGCTDPEALNYYAEATVDDGSCQYPFICETGEEAYGYVYGSLPNVALHIVSDAGELVYASQGEFDWGYAYGEFCLEADVCYTAVITSEWDEESEWYDGVFGVSTAFEDVAYALWPVDENVWAVPFSLNGDCEAMDWEAYLGCTDELAINYDPEALIDDGTCIAAAACDGLIEVEFVLNGGQDPDEVGLRVSNEAGDLLMDMDGYTGSSIGCVPAGCYTVEMLDSSGDGWNGAMAELFVDGEPAGTMALEEGDYEMQVIGLGMNCAMAVAENEGGNWSMELFPNPGRDHLTIRTSLVSGDEQPVVRVFNAEGRMIADLTHVAQGTAGRFEVDASAWAPGMYIIHMSQDGMTKRMSWAKMR